MKKCSHETILLEKKKKVEEELNKRQILLKELSFQVEKENAAIHVLSGALQAYEEVLASGELS